jgi:TonB family protein
MVMPVYPERALKDRVRGLVILRVTVSEIGIPTDVVVEKPGREGLTEAAVDAAKQWRFEPGRKGGRAVRTYATVQFPFEGVQFARTPLDLNATPGPLATPTPSP